MSDKTENINNNITSDVVDNIVLGNVSKAKDEIHDILKHKISGEIEDYKKEFAATIFADEPSIEDIEVDDVDLTDETNVDDVEIETEKEA